MKYRVNDIFHSLQGEGINAGRAAIFIRFSGCNLKCPFCDTDFKSYREMTVEDIIESIKKDVLGEKPMPRLCVITGGEPTLQVDFSLLAALHDLGMQIAIETNGTKPVPLGIDFVTVSPKSPFAKHAEVVVDRCTEVKVVMTEDISIETIRSFEKIEADYYYIQPCDTGYIRNNKAIMWRCVDFIKNHPNWRLSLQQQKILNIA